MSNHDLLDDILQTHLTGYPSGTLPFYYAPTTRYITDNQDILAAVLKERYGAIPWRDEGGNILVTMPDGATFYLDAPDDWFGEAATLGYHWLRNQVVPNAVSAVGGLGGAGVGAAIAKYLPLPAPLYAAAQFIGPLAGAYFGKWGAREIYNATFNAARNRLINEYGDYRVPPARYLERSPAFEAQFGEPFGMYATSLSDYILSLSAPQNQSLDDPYTLSDYISSTEQQEWPNYFFHPPLADDATPSGTMPTDYADPVFGWKYQPTPLMNGYVEERLADGLYMPPAANLSAPVFDPALPMVPASYGSGFSFANGW